jgi:CO/xanthine dehydrogenase FAD-binding subunit
MITEYHRPQTIEDALELLGRSTPKTLPLAGGTFLNQRRKDEFAVVDLQDLHLNTCRVVGNSLEIGASTTLQELLDFPQLPLVLKQVIQLEATYNLRQVASVAGTLVSATGRSPFTTAFLALDARLTIQPNNEMAALAEVLMARLGQLPGKLITQITLPLNAKLAYHAAARTPADLPLVCAAVVQWPSGRTRVALGGFGSAPLLALDGPEPGGIEEAVSSAYQEAGDEWASAEYRREAAVTLANRGLLDLQEANTPV